jgi:hypothetical protein
MTKYPMQPIEFDDYGVIRFKRNRIVDDLLSFATVKGGGSPGYETPYTKLDLNEISRGVQNGRYSVEEYEQLCQLIGYSVSGFGDLSLVRKRTVSTADRRAYKLAKEKK